MTYFLYDGSNPVCELDGSGSVLATNTWGGKLLSRRAGSASTFYTFDPQGSVAQRLDASANVLGVYAFDAYGLRTGTDTTTDPYAGFGGGYGYYADAETGLSLLGHRYYDTGTGRFVTRDPIGYAGGADLYAYCGNNPVMGTDPSGFCGGDGRDGWNTASDFFGGFGHIGSFGLTDWINSQSGANDVVNSDSVTYKAGEVSAFVDQLIIMRGTYTVPKYLYHFTSAEAGAAINASGVLRAGAGLYGEGVYLTRFPSTILATIQGARSTQAAVRVLTTGLNIKPTIFPGTFRAIGDIVLHLH